MYLPRPHERQNEPGESGPGSEIEPAWRLPCRALLTETHQKLRRIEEMPSPWIRKRRHPHEIMAALPFLKELEVDLKLL